MTLFVSFIYQIGMVNAISGTHMEIAPPEFTQQSRRSNSIRLGYVRLLDAAPLIVADSLGLFRDAGLDVTLSREVGWATIRDKLAFGELDVVQALSPMPFVMRLGLGVTPTEALTGMVLSWNGNAITLSMQLREEGIEDGESLARYIKRGYRPRKLVFGVVSQYSSHYFILCRWLEAHGIDPKEDVIVTVLPPEQMVRNIASGNIDGFCVGEPWNSIAVEEGLGWCPATSAQIEPAYPEKVLMTTERFNTYRPDEYSRMIAVLQQACAFCEDVSRRKELFNILSKAEYLNCTPETMAQAFSGAFSLGFERVAEGAFIGFDGGDLNKPDAKRSEQVLSDLCRYTGQQITKAESNRMVKQAYRPDIYQQAMSADCLV